MTYRHDYTTLPSYEAAKVIVPHLIKRIGLPQFVVDLGGGAGGFLRAMKEQGVARVKCIDHPEITRDDLLIDFDDFQPINLATELPEPVECDLVICTEVAEHLPASKSSAIVNYLTSCSQLILFSAAIPKQGGVGHVNEQWPEFWQAQFATRGYRRLDIIRPCIIWNQELPFWFRQNLFVYVSEDELKRRPDLSKWPELLPTDFELVHLSIVNKPLSLKEVVLALVPALKRSFKYRFLRESRRQPGRDA